MTRRQAAITSAGLAAAVALAAAGIASSQQSDATPRTWSDRIIVTRSGPAPAGCGVARAAAAVSQAWQKFNAGNIRGMMNFFSNAAGPAGYGFRVFSSGESSGRVTLYSRAATAHYLVSRYRRGDRFHLLLLQVTPDRGSTVSVYYTFAMTNRHDEPNTDDISRVDGKGSLNCPKRTTFQWVMSPEKTLPDDPTSIASGVCPVPESWSLGAGAIACIRTG